MIGYLILSQLTDGYFFTKIDFQDRIYLIRLILKTRFPILGRYITYGFDIQDLMDDA